VSSAVRGATADGREQKPCKIDDWADGDRDATVAWPAVQLQRRAHPVTTAYHHPSVPLFINGVKHHCYR
jgi:hypothetical protein